MNKQALMQSVADALDQIEVERSIDLSEFKNEHFYSAVVGMCYDEAKRMANKHHDAKASDFISEMTYVALDERGAIPK